MKKMLSAFMLLALARCTPVQGLNAITPSGGLTITKNVAYAPGNRHTLDIYRPKDAHGLPVIVFFYGGSWREGSKQIYPFVAATLARRGNIVIVPDYRLYPEVQFPAFLRDCAQAVGWTQQHLASLGGDPTRVFLMGHSAGAYNAVMLGLDPHYLAEAGVDRARIAGIIGLAGPYDFLPITGADIKPVFAPVNDGPESQPITYVDGHNPPLLLLAGEADHVVKPKNTRALAAKVRQLGGSAETRFYPGISHVQLVLAIAPAFQWLAPVLRDVQAFIDTHSLAHASNTTQPPSGHASNRVPHEPATLTMDELPG
jgi:acetyl esterase/lipase